MGFTLPNDVVKDHERKGRLRAKTHSRNYSEASEVVDFKSCDLHDCSSRDYAIDYHKAGFDALSLKENQALQDVLRKVKQQGWLEKSDQKNIKQSLIGKSYRLSNGKRLRIFYVANEGLIIRSSGPNGMQIKHGEAVPKNSRQAAALLIHGDQDVYGFPVKKILKGGAPWIFNHRSPDGSNKISPFNLVNIWIPLQQITMPLCLMDRSTLDKDRHQLRMEISVEEVLERDKNESRNDIWSFLYDEKQQWYFHSDMSYDKAYVFDTLGMAHGAAILLGEKQAEVYFLRLKECLEAVKNKNAEELKSISAQEKENLPENITAPLARAIKKMEALLEIASNESESIIESPQVWQDKVEAVLNALTRKSIELRAVGVIY
jgi:hypothetical protein